MPLPLPVLVLGCLLLAGCVREVPTNPAFDLSVEEARREIEAMEAEKKPFRRPVLVLAGFGDPGLAALEIAERLRRTTTTPERVTSVAYLFDPTIESAREKTIRHARERFDDGEFDIVGFSMGGLIARLACEPVDEGLPALRAETIFTISTPNRGAKAADLPSFDPKVLAMRPGSALLRRLQDTLEDAPYELICYVRLGDGIVGHENASPFGHPVLWVPNEPYDFAHLGAGSDPRLIADIARRLRGERAYADLRGAPVPELE
ncbi:MAG: hypothetical protein Tsb0013_08970 [Phycisphaerales bacterium]